MGAGGKSPVQTSFRKPKSLEYQSVPKAMTARSASNASAEDTSHGISRSRSTRGGESSWWLGDGSSNCCGEAMVASMLPDTCHFCERTLSAPGTRATALPSFSMTSAAAGSSGLTPEQISAIDAAHLWHPYSTIGAEAVPPVVVVGARGAGLTLVRDGEHVQALDAMSSWWTAIHGHGHPVLDAAMTSQLATMNHVMFGGLTHEPAARLAQLLVDITPDGLENVFFSDSAWVSVEVAVKMALQYWRSRDRSGKHRLMTWRGGYHGDTFTPMSICDPDGGMHSLWTDILARQVFAPQVPRDYDAAYVAAFEEKLAEHAAERAAV